MSTTVVGVADRSAAVQDMAVDWALAEALLGGTRTMREKGTTYLPKFPNETDAAYVKRLQASVLFPAYARTVQTLSAKPFTKPITLGENIPTNVADLLSNVDLQGRNLDAFAVSVLREALGYGLSGILVDYPQRGDEVRTLAAEQAAGLRPYWIQVRPQQILGWRAARVGGSWRLTQLRLLESVEVPDGDFGTKFIDQVRVLEPGVWSIYQHADGSASNGVGGWSVVEAGTTTLSYIPFVPVYGQRMGFMTARPPLIEVAHLNVSHWQSASDQQNILHVARVPILTIAGVTDDQFTLTVGASSAIKLPEGGKLEFVEHSGAAIEAGAKDLAYIEERMRQAGAELIVMPTAFAVTATQVLTENAVGMSLLQQIAAGVEDALDQALQITTDWLSGEGRVEGGNVTLYSDYGAATLAEASAQLLLQTNQAGKLSDETYHSELQRRGILSTDVSWEEEQERIEAQGPPLGTMSESGGDPLPAPAVVTSATAQPAPEPLDVQALGAAIASAVAGIQFPAPVVNVAPAAAPQITVESPNITVNVPPQEPPVVNVAPAAITVEAPQITVEAPNITLPEINVTPPNVTVNPAPVHVTIEKGGEISFTEDDAGNITGAKLN